MEKSIEALWKEGFLTSDALVAPRVNSLYDRKSIHMIEKFEKMFRNNIWGIILGASFLFIASYFAGALLAGTVVLLLMLYVAYTAYDELQALKKIDKGASSYIFLKSFKGWIDRSTERYGSMYRVVYPILLLTVYLGIWFSDVFEPKRELVIANSTDVFFGMHTYTTLVVLLAAVMMAIFSKAIHRRDVGIIYGQIIKKLDRAIAEMEELSRY